MELQLDADLRAIVALSDQFGRHRVLVWAYVELFGVTPIHARAKKLRRLLEEIKALFDAEAFKYRGRQYRIGADGIAEALNIVVHRNFADGLDSHNYLKKVMIGISEREDRTRSIQDEKTLRKREDALRGGFRQVEEPREIPPEAKAEIARIFGLEKVL
jgi:hypothetical protein